jgi:hypothetical protein
VNITIKITHISGTITEVSIPMGDSTAVSMPSAPVTPVAPQVASEPAIPAASGLVDCFGDEVTKEDLKPSGNRYKSVAELIDNCNELSRENTSGEKRVGEDGEGDGRIGGMGERKEEGGEGEGGEENHDQFKCADGFYVITPALYSDFCAAFGAPTVDRELQLARLWVETNPDKRKTRRGMGRFLNGWLCRSKGEKRTPVKGRSGSLLEANNTSQQGW